MTKKTRFVLIVLTLSLYILWISGGWKMVNGFAGSYPYAESWDLDAKETRVIKIIEELKKEHPELLPPGEIPSTIDRDSWCYIHFYYTDTKELVHTILGEGSNPNTTVISFIHLSTDEQIIKPRVDSLSIKLSLDTPMASQTKTQFRTINRDYGYFANKQELRKFEEVILDKIIEKLKNME